MKNGLRLPHILVALAICLAGLITAGPARADDTPQQLNSLTISVWLEYDQPGVLYIYRGELPAGEALPARLTFRLPTRPNSTAGIDENGAYRYVQPTLAEDGDNIIVNYETRWPHFQLEYYYDALQQQGAIREFELAYRAEYAIDDLILEIKEPFGAAGFSLEPATDTQSQAEDGLMLHRRVIGPVAPGQEVRWKVSYTKEDPRLAAEALGLPTPQPVQYESTPSNMVAQTKSNNWLIWGGATLLGMIAVGWLWLTVRMGGRRAAIKAAQAGLLEAGGGQSGQKGQGKDQPEVRVRRAKYCHQCGATLNKNDSFCRQCGTRRRGD